MSRKRYQPGVITWGFVLVTAFLIAYSSAYFAIVQPREGVNVCMFSVADTIPLVPDYSGGSAPDYIVARGGQFWDRAFAPIHWLDCKIIRPAKWAPVLPKGIR